MRMPALRLFAILGIALAGAAAGDAREAPDDAEAISPWSAPPYWTPPSSGRQAHSAGRQALAAGPTALPFISLFPCRLVDTRAPAFPAPLGGGFLPPATVRSYTLTGVCNVPTGAKAISLNVTVVKPTGPGFITLYPEGGAFPPVSTLNYLGNDVIVNAAVVPLSATGGISMALGVSGGDVILDTNGYYASVPSVTSLNTLTGDLTLAAGSNVTLTPSGQTLTISASGAQGPTGPAGPTGPPGPTGWALTGNAGTTPGTNFIGTTDNQALELKVNGHRGLRIEPQAPAGTNQGPNLILGYEGNYVAAGVNGATVSGGGFNGASVPNRVTGHFGTVAGGYNNLAGDVDGDPVTGSLGAIGGGYNNWASGGVSTIGGGQSNTASGVIATVGGGIFNTASGSVSTVGGGSQNSARGDYATVPGGALNAAGGLFSLAAGFRAKVRDAAQSGVTGGDLGTFVWADSQPGDFVSTGPNQFLIRAGGGVGINTNAPSGDLQLGAASDAAAFRFGSSGTRNHLISNRDMVFNAHSASVTGSPLFYWRRNPNRFDESSFADLMRLTDTGSLLVFGGVGINTTSPGYPLEVSSAGDTQIGLRSDTTGGRIWTLQSSNGQAGGTLAGSFQIVDRTVGQSRLAITSAGLVGINTTDPLGFTFSVNGSASKPGGGSWSLYSDARLKRDIRPLQGTLDRLLALRGVTFEYVDPEAIHELPGSRIGMVAQEVETVYPDWVSEGPDGYRRLTIRGFEALTVEALRDLRREKDDEIRALKSALEAQRAEIAALRAAIDLVRAELAERRSGRDPRSARTTP